MGPYPTECPSCGTRIETKMGATKHIPRCRPIIATRIAEVLALPVGAIVVAMPVGAEALRDGARYLVRERRADGQVVVANFDSAAEAAARLVEIQLAEPDDAEVSAWFKRVMGSAQKSSG